MTNPETLDLASLLAGQTYPEEVVLIPLDRKSAKELYDKREELKIKKNIRDIDKDIVLGLQAEVLELEEIAKNNALRVTVRGLSRDDLKNLQLSTSEASDTPRGEDETLTEYNLRKGEAIQKLYWGAYIVRIQYPDGSDAAVDEAAIGTLVQGIADPAAEDIQKAIVSIDKEARDGFESVVFDSDF